MATVTHEVVTPDTSNLANASGAFVPALDDLLVVFVTIEGNTTDHALSSSIGGFTFTQVRKELFRTSASALLVYVSDALVADTSSQTVTIPAPGSGSIIWVVAVAGMTKTGAAAVLKQGGESDQAAAGTPAPSFGSAALTANCCVGAVANATNPAGMTQPASWSEAAADSGYTTGAVHGLEVCFRNSGETGTTITWGSTSASIFASIILELDTSSSNTYEKLGFATAGDFGAGPSESIFVESGFALASLVGVGARARELMREGFAVAGLFGSGVSERGAAVYTKAGSGIIG